MATTNNNSTARTTRSKSAPVQLPPRRNRGGGEIQKAVGQTFDTTLGAVNSTLKTVGTTLSVLSKSAEIVDIKLDELKLEAWGDLQETRQETFDRLRALGMPEEEIQESFKYYNFH